MSKPKIAVFSGPASTIANSPPLVTSNKGRLKNEKLPGRFDHLVSQILHEPVTVKIRKFSAHPMEKDAAEVYHDDGKDYYEVTLRPEDGPYPLPYMARRRDGSPRGRPFEAKDLEDSAINYGGRQAFYPDASRIFEEIDRTVYGRDDEGMGSTLDRKANFTFIRALPPAGYTKRGEVSGVDYFPYKPHALARSMRVGDLARTCNSVNRALSSGKYEGAIWLEGSPHLEETMYWLSLLVDTDLPIAGNAAQRTHGMLSADGDRNIVDSVSYILSGRGKGLGVVGVQDQQIFAAREFKKADDRPGNYKATGGHGGILGTVKKDEVTIWYRPNYKHTKNSDVNLNKLPKKLEIRDGSTSSNKVAIGIKDEDEMLRPEVIPRVHIVKYAGYSMENERGNPEDEVDVVARVNKALVEQDAPESEQRPRLHGLVFEGTAPYARGSNSQMRALQIAALSGLPVARVCRSDPGGRVVTDEDDLFIEGSNLDANKARLLLIACMLKLGRFPRAKDPREPTSREKEAVVEKIKGFQKIFETH